MKRTYFDVRLSEKATLDLKEMMAYTGWGESYCRELLKEPYCTFRYMVGSKYFAKRKALDKYIEQKTG